MGAAVLAALAAMGWWVVRLGLRPLDHIGATAAAIAAGDLSRRVEQADERTEVGSPGPGPQPDAGPDRVRLRRTPGERGPPAALRGRRQPRAAHAAHVDPGLRRAVPPGGGRPPRGPGHGHAPHRGGGRPHGRPGRGPASVGPPRPDRSRPRRARRCRSRAGPALRPRARRPGPPGRRRRRRRPGGLPRPPDHLHRRLAGDGPGRRPAAAPGGGQPAVERRGPHPTGHRGPGAGGGRRRSGPPPGQRRRSRPGAGGGRAGLRALLPGRQGPQPGHRRRRTRTVDRGRHRPGATGAPPASSPPPPATGRAPPSSSSSR